MFFVASKNNQDSLLPIKQKLDNAYFIGSCERPNSVKVGNTFPLFFAYLVALPFFPLVVWKFLTSEGYRKRTFSVHFNDYWLTYGFYIVARLWLARVSPTALVMSNDHSMSHRVINKAARRNGILTFYIQHASVTKDFPPLSFDYALLEGRDALGKYEQAGESGTKIFLIGMPKFDGYLQHVNTSGTVHSVGICTNPLDPISRVEQLCRVLSRELPDIRFILRPHPGDSRELWGNLAQEYQMILSKAAKELSFNFLRRVDAVIVGDSSMILEAALMDVFPLYYDFCRKHLDWYGFESQGLVQHFSDSIKLCHRLRALRDSKPSVREKAKIYCATVGTRYDGCSSELSSVLIRSILAGHSPGPEWVRVSDAGMEAYELAEAD